MKEIAEEEKFGCATPARSSEVDHPGRGKYLTVGNPVEGCRIRSREVKRSPLLGEHTEEILKQVLGLFRQGYCRDQAGRVQITAPEKTKVCVVASE